MKRKQTIIILLLVVLAVCSCSRKGQGATGTESNRNNSKGISIVTTIFPEYDWVREIIGEEDEDVTLTLLLDKGVDLHSFQPTVEDIMRVSTCDLFLYVGGESDEWVKDALRNSSNPSRKAISLMEALGDRVKEEELAEGMQETEEEEEEEPEYDEHIWLSLKNAQVLVPLIAEELAERNPTKAPLYRQNAKAYLEKLEDLDNRFQEVVRKSSQNTLLFGDRFPFRYLVDDYGLDYYAAFSGCSAETEASFDTIVFLSQKLDELKLPAVCTLERSDKRIASAIVQSSSNRNLPILTFDSLQSVTTKDAAKGVTYLSLMESNLKALEEALH